MSSMEFRASPGRARGVTLIELLVAVTIVAILARLAYPIYINSVMKGNRADAKEALVNASQILERCYSQNYSYTAASCPTYSGSPAVLSANKYYSIAASTTSPTTATTYTLVATPVAGSIQTRDKQCTTFTLSNTGSQGSTGTGTSSFCWTGH
jgi:type IV pilus assembly protein PilE